MRAPVRAAPRPRRAPAPLAPRWDSFRPRRPGVNLRAVPPPFDTVVVGAGAAGLMTAILACREAPGLRLALLEGTSRPGTKILVSGGGRCNVTNRVVRPADYHGDRGFVAKVLRRFDERRTAAFFEEIGVPLRHEAEFDKLFPATDDAHTVLDALVAECSRLGCAPRTGHRVTAVRCTPDGFEIDTTAGPVAARRVVLATGGRSLPRTGSDGAGYALARSLGHTVTPTVPALVPLLLGPAPGTADPAAGASPLAGLDGIALPVEIRVVEGGRTTARVRGPLLVTHFGISGPAALDVSRHWSVAAEAGRRADLLLSFFPGREPADLEREWLELARADGRRPASALVASLPRRVGERLLLVAGVAPDRRIAELARDARSRLLAACTGLPLPVRDTRGFNAAEVTAGGVPTSEVDPRTMESKVRPGLFLVGEVLDVEGRIGGFNFQWAWSGAFVCGQALATAARRGAAAPEAGAPAPAAEGAPDPGPDRGAAATSGEAPQQPPAAR